MRRRAATAIAAAMAIGATMFGAVPPAFADDVPYTDPAQVGYIGFCDANNNPISGGSLAAIPFAAKAVSSAPAPAPYNGNGRVAFINAYQARDGIPPAEWSGEALISASFYSNPAHPMVVGTKGDISMLQVVQDLPPQWDDLVQLRMYLKVPDLPYDALHYATADIKIDGDSWHLVGGGNVPCDSGQARSLASVLAPSAAAGAYNTPPATGTATTGDGASTPGVAGTTAPTSASPTSDGTASSTSPVANATSDGGSGDSFPIGYVVLGGLLAVLAAVLTYTQRQRLRSLLARRGGRT